MASSEGSQHLKVKQKRNKNDWKGMADEVGERCFRSQEKEDCLERVRVNSRISDD